MSLDTFRMTCPTHGVFTGQAAVDHIASCLGRKPGTIGMDSGQAYTTEWRPGWYTWRPCGQVVKARPWRAPKAPKAISADFLAKMAEQSARFGDVTHEYVTEAAELAA